MCAADDAVHAASSSVDMLGSINLSTAASASACASASNSASQPVPTERDGMTTPSNTSTCTLGSPTCPSVTVPASVANDPSCGVCGHSSDANWLSSTLTEAGSPSTGWP
eukprot:CAMPEP_0119475942 /NCGR_PEP_ID=MMETSP1344-20130328/6657_1 /TAXON_ID=236787 /ORGANISM="Florenciella parvula, Strain CCMP2471" /LENGTH=108 /DNA_ID=CAMNT_0007509605 /DNA_START=60 /DNA_END=384 /DNA_ORIENTATION=+